MARASEYEMKARPLPLLITSSVFTFSSRERFPRIEKMVNPASSEVKVSVRLMIHASLTKKRNILFPFSILI